jgi:hypothetical protein
VAGYVDKEVARQRKILADAVAGKGLRKAIRALQERSKVYDSFGEAKKRGSITSKHKVAKRTGVATLGDRQELSRAYYTTVRELKSSDGLFTIEFANLSRLTFDSNTDRFLDYDPDAP